MSFLESTTYPETYEEREARERVEFQQALVGVTPHVVVTPILIVANIAVYLVMIAKGVPSLSPTGVALIRWGADYGPLTTHGQWWRLASAAFLHVGLWHLAMNMVVLWRIGPFVERLFGNVSFLVLYLLAALLGNVVSLAVHPTTVAAGASGAIFGLYGGLATYLLLQRTSIPKTTLSSFVTVTGAFLALNLIPAVLSGLLSQFTLGQGAIDIAAHAGGFAAGCVAGGVLALPLSAADTTRRLRRSGITALAGAAVVTASALVIPVVDDPLAAIGQFVLVERDSLGLYRESLAKVEKGAITRSQFGEVVDRQLLPRWSSAQHALTALRLDDRQRPMVAKLVEYMTLRADEWRLMAQGVRTNDAGIVAQSRGKAEAAGAVASSLRMTNARVPNAPAPRRTGDPFTTEVQKVVDGERARTRVYDDLLRRMRSQQLTKEQCADAIERRVLQPWNDERTALSNVPLQPFEGEAVKGWLDYMTLRAEAWQLIATGLRKNDAAMILSGNEKADAAAKLKQLDIYR